MENQEQQTSVRADGMIAGAIREMIAFMKKELIFRGILFLLLGLLMTFRPVRALLAITIVTGVLILFDGIAMLVSACRYRGERKVLFLLHAVFCILLGIFSCTAPLVMNVVWMILIGFWLLLSGVQCLSFRSQGGISALFSGLCGIIVGLLLIFMPVFGAIALTWLMGILCGLCGVSSILLGIRLKKAWN